MTLHLQREIANLKKKILVIGTAVEESLQQAVRVVEKRDPSGAKEVVRADTRIDEMEVELEEDCLKVLALHQPFANDLRLIIAVLKINNDLERIGDLAANIAGRAKYITELAPVDVPFDFPLMASKVQAMLKMALDSLVNEDSSLARQVCAADDEIDDMHRDMYKLIEQRIQDNPDQTGPLIRMLTVARHLERIADHTTNIAEDVIYLLEGEIVRHRPDAIALDDEVG